MFWRKERCKEKRAGGSKYCYFHKDKEKPLFHGFKLPKNTPPKD